MNDSRLPDALMLVSRLEEQGGDIRFLFRKDPDVHREIYVYLDELTWLSKRPLVQPDDESEERTRDALLASVRSQKMRRHHDVAGILPRIAGASLTLGLLLGGALSAHAATAGVPQPVSDVFNDVRQSFGQHGAEAAGLTHDTAPKTGDSALPN